MSEMNVDVLFAAVPVSGLATALPWYENLFGRAPDMVPHDHEVMWKVVDAGWLYVVEDAPRAGHGLVTMSVPDLDDAVEEVGGRGLRPEAVENVGDAGRKATFRDPDGNEVSIIEVTGASE
jgi:predicted enzyme related to lactoylglutathione lyase